MKNLTHKQFLCKVNYYINLFKQQNYNFYIYSNNYGTEYEFNQFGDTINCNPQTYINRHYQNIGFYKSMELFAEVQRISRNNTTFILSISHITNINKFELIERLQEFDVVINGQLDELNLEKLFNFYGITYTNQKINLISSYHKTT